VSAAGIHDMTEIGILIIVVVIAGVIVPVARRWYRHRQASRLADTLLEKVLRDKDAFRR
jgi:hypothetical protein